MMKCNCKDVPPITLGFKENLISKLNHLLSTTASLVLLVDILNKDKSLKDEIGKLIEAQTLHPVTLL